MKAYHLSIITPDGKVFDEDIQALSAPGQEGSFGVLADHAPLLALLKEGVLKLTQNAAETFYAIGAGMLEFNHKNTCLILADSATPCRSLEEAKEQITAIDKT
ncbi:MAG: ATP synthase F1 subunit epsilon [Candidatus Omnitrophica bacterium]|nr:ATP synthase F1 subunit epsilon [Candidatus Omnitrophota bacterium]